MGYPVHAAGAGASSVAAIIRAVRASGVIVRVDPRAFLDVLARVESPLVVTAEGGFLGLGKNFQYLTSYKGFAFFAKSPEPLPLSEQIEIVAADKIWIPG